MYSHEYQLKLAMGLDESTAKHMPRDMETTPVLVDGVQVYIRKGNEPGKRFHHRVTAICPHCSKHVSAGRYHQHAKVHGLTLKFKFYPENVQTLTNSQLSKQQV